MTAQEVDAVRATVHHLVRYHGVTPESLEDAIVAALVTYDRGQAKRVERTVQQARRRAQIGG